MVDVLGFLYANAMLSANATSMLGYRRWEGDGSRDGLRDKTAQIETKTTPHNLIED